MIVQIGLAGVAAALLYVVMTSKKTIPHMLREIKYELKFQDIGFWGVVDDQKKKKENILEELPVKTGQVAVVTGGARGIGVHIVKTLAQCGMKVIIGVRNVEAGKKLARDIQELGLPGSVDVYQLDVSSIKSVEEFGRKVAKEYKKIHLLVNNAGIMFGDYKVSPDGFENQLATNYLGHFLLTHFLLSSLKAAGETSETCARVVNVTSVAHKATKIFFDDMNWDAEYITSAAYGQSKLAQVMSAKYLDRMFENKGVKVRCYSVHPGVVNTDLFNGTPVKMYAQWIINMFFKTPEQGAVSILHACFSPKLEKEGGAYISNCGTGTESGYSKKEDKQKELFVVTCDMLKLFDFGVVKD